jgi:hypothetical protein
MKTKSGKSHFEVDVKITESTGKIRNEHWKFCTKNPQQYLEAYEARAKAIGNLSVKYINLVNLDEEV